MSRKIIAVAIEKGGIGKTTTVVNLAYMLAMSGKKVLVIDCDAQANATMTLTDVSKYEWGENGLFDLINSYKIAGADPHNYVHQAKHENISIIPSTKYTPQIISLFRFLYDKNPALSPYKYLSLAIEPIIEEYDYIIIDTPPSQDDITLSALYAATDVIIPTVADKYSQEGLLSTIRLINDLKKKENVEINVLGILLVRTKRTVLQDTSREALQESQLNPLLFKSEIRESVAVAECIAANDAVVEKNPKSNPAKDYFEFFKEFNDRIAAEDK